jgi:hypothetical protein
MLNSAVINIVFLFFFHLFYIHNAFTSFLDGYTKLNVATSTNLGFLRISLILEGEGLMCIFTLSLHVQYAAHVK